MFVLLLRPFFDDRHTNSSASSKQESEGPTILYFYDHLTIVIQTHATAASRNQKFLLFYIFTTI